MIKVSIPLSCNKGTQGLSRRLLRWLQKGLLQEDCSCCKLCIVPSHSPFTNSSHGTTCCCMFRPGNDTDRFYNGRRYPSTKAANKLHLSCQNPISYSLLCSHFGEIHSMLLVILSGLEQADRKTPLVHSSSVPKYLSPNSPMPGMTRKSLFNPISISDVTIFILGKRLQTICTP